MTNKQHLELNLSYLISDQGALWSFNHPSTTDKRPFSDVVLALVDLEIKRLESELLNYR